MAVVVVVLIIISLFYKGYDTNKMFAVSTNNPIITAATEA